ncbi:MAG: Gfo/Idh/MocA family oxidoreductase [Chloroflexi bacterium]|nr:Gfo/Idh/MocA family oxidoreductase [Chloroflexota bacterium]
MATEAPRPPLRAALIGCGHISSRHVPAWQASPDAELVAVCDQDRARAEARAREFGIAKVYDSVEQMLDTEPLDCVDIATHDVTHTSLVTQVASRGLAVLCQKPLAPTLAEARAMVELTARAGVRFMVMEMWRHLKPVRDMKRHLDAGLIGDVYALRLLAPPRFLRRTRPIDDQQPYLADLPKLMVYDTYIHHIDGIRYLLGDVSSVYARMSHTNPAIVGEDRLFLIMGHASGATSSLDASWVVPAEKRTKLGLGDFLIEGVDGALHLDPHDAQLRHVTFGGTTVLEQYETHPAGGGGPMGQAAFNSCIGDFAAGVRHGRPFESDAADNLKTLAITLASYESVARGTAVAPSDAP